MTQEKLKGLLDLNELMLTDDEEVAVLKVFSDMEKAEAVVAAADTDNTDIMVHVRPMTNILREDVRKQDFSRADLLKGAPQATEDSWQVPRLVK